MATGAITEKSAALRQPLQDRLAHPPRARGVAAALAALLMLAATAAAHGDAPTNLTDAWRVSSALSKAGDHLGAATLLRPWAERFDQDYNLQLEVAWQYYQAHRYADALTFYDRADRLADSPGLARLGRAWTALALGNHDRAAMLFRQVLARGPNPSAQRGLAALERRTRKPASPATVWGYVSPRYYDYSNHVDRVDAIGVRAGFGVTGVRGLQLALAFARTEFRNTDLVDPNDQDMGNKPTRNDGSGDISNTEAYATAGWAFSRAALYVHGGVARAAGTTGDQDAIAAGATARLSLFHDLYAGGIVARINGVDSTQAKLAWAATVARPLRVTVAGTWLWPQDRDVQTVGSALLELRLGRVGLWASGRVGRNYHMVDFALPLMWNQDEDVMWSGAVGSFLRLGRQWSVAASAAAEGYELNGMTSRGTFLSVALRFDIGGDR